jgi:hypothetical protein
LAYFSIFSSSLECSEPPELGHSERERLRLAAWLPMLWLQPLPQAKAAFDEKWQALGFLHSW